MKKSLLSILCLLVTIGMMTGCDSNERKNEEKSDSFSGKLTCTRSETDEDGYETSYEMIVNYKNDKVTTVEETSIAKMDKDVVDASYTFTSLFAEVLNKIDGMKVTYSKEGEDALKSIVKVDYSKINVNQIKEALGESFDNTNAFYKNEATSLEDFKKQNLTDYTCK